MRIFHLITHFSLGGAERVAANIAESQTHGMEYHVVEIMRGRTAYTPKFIGELEKAGVRCHRSWMPDVSFHFLFERIAALLFPLRMLYIMLRWRPDVIHTHTETPDLALYVFSRLFPFMLRRVKIVRTIHNTRLWTGLPRTAQWVETFFKIFSASMGVQISARISQLTGSTSYLPAAAVVFTSSSVGCIFMAASPLCKNKNSPGLFCRGSIKQNAPDRRTLFCQGRIKLGLLSAVPP